MQHWLLWKKPHPLDFPALRRPLLQGQLVRKTNVPMVPKKITGTRFAQILVPGRFNSPFEAWCEIMRVYEKPYEDNKYTRAGEAIQPIQTEYVQQDERFLEVADPQRY